MTSEKTYDGEILLSTLWNQSGVIECGNNTTVEFNKYAPKDPLNGKRSYTGCGNTSMGQIVYYFLENDLLDFNLTLTEQDIYADCGYGIQRLIPITAEGGGAADTLSFAEVNERIKTFISAPADPDAADYTEQSIAAAEYIAALNYACGVLNATGYSNLTGSGSYPSVNVFKRTGFKSYLALEDLSSEERKRWFKNNGNDQEVLTDEGIEILIENLLDGRPVSVYIEGHFIVMDGYDSETDKFHLNYGWGRNGMGSETEGSAEGTKWYSRSELANVPIKTMELELRGSYVEEFTVTDSRFYGAGTFLHTLEKANAMQGRNVISFSDTVTPEVIEVPYAYELLDELVIRDFNLTVFGAFPADGAEHQEADGREQEKAKILFRGGMGSHIRLENFNGNAVLQTETDQQDSIFDFSNSVRTDLFFNGAAFYIGGSPEEITDPDILAALGGEDADALANSTKKAIVISASSGDDTIKFDEKSIAVGKIDLNDGFNNLIVAGGSQLFGDIAGSGANHIFIDGTSSITGTLKNETKLNFCLKETNSQALFTITDDASETIQNIAGLVIDATQADVGEYLLFSWLTPAGIDIDNVALEIIGNGQVTVKDNSLVLTVTDPGLIESPDEWSAAAVSDGNAVTLNWSNLTNAAGYCYRYAGDAEALAGNGTAIGTNSADLLLNNGTWYFQVRAFDSQGNYSDWSSATEFTVKNTVESKTNTYLANGILEDQTINSSFTVFSGGILNGVAVTSTGTLTLEEGSITTGPLHIEENGSVEVFSGAAFIFDISSLEEANGQAVINDYAAVNGTFRLGIAVSADQANGTYLLADNVDGWDYSLDIKVQADDMILGTFNEENMEFVYNDKAYNLVFSQENKQLLLSVTDACETETAQDGSTRLRWQAPVGAKGYVIEFSKSEEFDSSIHFVAENTNQMEIVTPIAENCHWRVLAAGLEDAFTYGGEIQGDEISDTPRIYEGHGNEGAISVFFANSSGTWGQGYVARYCGQNEDLNVEDVVLKGKVRYHDIFQGNRAEKAANILYLSDNENGDVFFTDDIYSAFPSEQDMCRFSDITHIYAGAGDDIIDMTSTRYEPANDGIFLHGGAGNDTLWSDSSSFLFGDEGNDSIIGSSQTDYISGGAGDDVLYGGGGDDFFLFGAPGTWGHDEIYQGDDGSVNIVFPESGNFVEDNQITVTYEADKSTITLTYDENNSITIYGRKGQGDLTVVEPGNVSGFDAAYAAGGFAPSSSQKVFEESSEGILA